MFISGFTFIKNAIINDYPIKEAISSILPIVDEMIVLVGDSTDNTLQYIQAIDSNKIKIHHSVWDKNLKNGGQVLADETNKALALVNPQADWAFYIQADEVVHEKYHQTILNHCLLHLDNKKVMGLVFNYLHFYGNYQYYGDSRQWYSKEIRIIRPKPQEIFSYKDAQGFRWKNNQHLPCKLIPAFIFHYGWVKNPYKMENKIKNSFQYWQENQHHIQTEFNFAFENHIDSIAEFKETHPFVMKERIRLQDWDIKFDVQKKRFNWSKKIMYWIEKKLGIRLFEFRNYDLI
ncbi:MAG: glycosyltransferase family 2 protein [Sediminibacterium sp.]|nr:glycosyltransferase family 2 protein [Sediminibacterium sp.]